MATRISSSNAIGRGKGKRCRSGCWTCREAGYKCDEAKPFCGRCVRLKRSCQGYGLRLKWRHHKESRSKIDPRPLPNHAFHDAQLPADSNATQSIIALSYTDFATSSPSREMSTSFPNKRDEAEQRQDPIRFTGDTVPPNGPPLAWVLLWGGKYANIYGEYVPESLRRWGYVIWDKVRWDSMEAKELIARQWEMEPELVEEIKIDIGWSPLESGSVTIEHK